MSEFDLKHVHKMSNKHLLKRCAHFFLPYKWRVLFAFICAAGVSGANAATAYLVKPAMDNIFVAKDADSLILVPLAFFGVITGKGICRFFQVYIMNVTGFMVLHTLRDRMFRRIVALPLRYFEESRVGMLMSRVTGDVSAIRQSVPSGVMLIREAFTCVGLVGVVLYQDWQLALKALVVLPLCIFPIVYFGKKLRKLGRKNQIIAADLSSAIQEKFSAIQLIKAFGTESKEADGFENESGRVVKVSKRVVFVSELSTRYMELIGGIAVAFVLWYGGAQVLAGKSTPGTFFSFVAALIMLYEPIKKINESNKTIQQSLASAERVFGLLDSEAIAAEAGGEKPFTLPMGDIEIDGITFQYPTASTPAINDLTLTIRQGERVALVGSSGSGKTTLANLIPRFYDVDSGEIRIGGTPTRDFQLVDLRRNIGIVSQESVLLNTTIRKNMGYGQDSVSDEHILQASKAAFAHEFIELLPDGYDTMCGERGVKLSGGQKQRITIARALIKDPALLILDEATSALDTQSERIVQKALDNLMEDRTSIVIAHRLSTVLSADKIVVMQKGRIVGMGRHEELLENCPLYQTLYNMQFAETISEDEAREMSAAE